jgi:tRNA(Ile)-lysidine synthase
MLNKFIKEFLKDNKNLLAFSAGVDSSALFLILLKERISFDIAFVNYNLREQSKLEEEYAKELAKKYDKKIYIASAPKFKSNFEAQAREFRYNFFKEIINKHNYANLLTAHQLNDKLEWFLMRFSKGAGISELSAMNEFGYKDGYNIIRPLLNYTKSELLELLEKESFKYFIDSSNFDKKYERNRFRPLVNTLLKEGKKGFLKSFEILQNEQELINLSCQIIYRQKELLIAKVNNNLFIKNCVAKLLKELKYVISHKDREQFCYLTSAVIGRKWAIEIENNYIFIAPYIKMPLTKDFKEKCRKAKIPPKIRGYIFKNNLDINKIKLSI